jgi:serine/threonine protein phosphatase PrpC
MSCGCTAVVMLVIESKVYTFHVGDCKSYLFRNEVLYKMNIDHLPVTPLPRRAEEISATASRLQAGSSSTTASWASARSPAASDSSSTRYTSS